MCALQLSAHLELSAAAATAPAAVQPVQHGVGFGHQACQLGLAQLQGGAQVELRGREGGVAGASWSRRGVQPPDLTSARVQQPASLHHLRRLRLAALGAGAGASAPRHLGPPLLPIKADGVV